MCVSVTNNRALAGSNIIFDGKEAVVNYSKLKLVFDLAMFLVLVVWSL